MRDHSPLGGEPITAEWWPIGQSKRRYGFSRSTTNRLVAEELVEARKLGSLTLINDGSVRRYMASLPRASIKRDGRSARLARHKARAPQHNRNER
jgi:hypothetical protein